MTQLGDQKVLPQLIMAKTRHKFPRTVMRYVEPGDAAAAEGTSLLGSFTHERAVRRRQRGHASEDQRAAGEIAGKRACGRST